MWRAAADGRLDIQRCDDCGAHRHPPVGACYRCGSVSWHWDTVPGTGTVVTYSWLPDRQRSADEGREVFYNVAVVGLDGVEGEPVRVVTNVLDAWERVDLAVGQRVELSCVKLSDDVGLPCFVKARGAPADRRRSPPS
jgi:uncharacterized OB-fold protein